MMQDSLRSISPALFTFTLALVGIILLVRGEDLDANFSQPLALDAGVALLLFACLRVVGLRDSRRLQASLLFASVALLVGALFARPDAYLTSLLVALGVGCLLLLALEVFLARRLESLDRIKEETDAEFFDFWTTGFTGISSYWPSGRHSNMILDLPAAHASHWEAVAYSGDDYRQLNLSRSGEHIQVTEHRGKVKLWGSRRDYDPASKFFSGKEHFLGDSECRLLLGQQQLTEILAELRRVPFGGPG